MKAAYISIIRALRALLAAIGVLGYLERRRDRRLFLWARSLFAIYDFKDLVSLDIPWWNLDAKDRVAAFLETRDNAKVFEYGSGSSTVWLAKRAGHITSVEHDPLWFSYLKDYGALPANVSLLNVPTDTDEERDESCRSGRRGDEDKCFGNYVHAITKQGKLFDLIVIDGRARVACLRLAKDYLAEGGIILFDNAGRKRYQTALSSSGFEIEEYSGLTACLPYPDQTYLLKRVPAE